MSYKKADLFKSIEEKVEEGKHSALTSLAKNATAFVYRLY